ncbi:MAG: DMT family transporter [Flavobacteriales bacterium]|nr:DMT family transporter [Flavobacteriales bacterium]
MKKFLTSTTFLASICCVLWASPFVPLKIGLEYMPRPIEFAGYRFFFAGLFIALYVGINKKYFFQVKRNLKKILIISVFHTSLLYSFFYLGQMRVDGAIGALVVGSQPLFVAVMAHFMKKDDRLSWRKIISIILGLTGLVVIAWDKVSEVSLVGWSSIVGILFLVGNNMTSGFSNVLISRTKTDHLDPLVFSSSQLMVGGATLLAVSYTFWGYHGLPSQMQWWVSLAVLIFISTIAIGVWFVLLARPGVKVSELNMWKFLIPIIGSLESWAILPDEHPYTAAVIGLVILTLSLLLLNYSAIRNILVNRNNKNNE